MEGMPAVYCGRLVSKENFRAFIYNTNSEKKLVESWNEFVAHMEIGLWFSTEEDAIAAKQSAVELEKEEALEVKKNSTKARK